MNAFYLDIGVALLLAAISASAWNIVGGYAGQISVGHSMFFGAGAYLPLLFYRYGELPPVAGVPLGIALSLVLAVIVGMPTFRLPGHYFSMATIAVAELIRIWSAPGTSRRRDRPAGSGGRARLVGPHLPRRTAVLLHLPRRAGDPAVRHLSDPAQPLRLLSARDQGGRARRASLGVPVRRTKLKALMLSAAFTSVAGSLYAIKTGFIDPESGFGILVSVQMVIIAALGGAGTLFGPLVGALILMPLQTATNTWFGGGGTGLTYILYGGIIVLLARFEPGGLGELWGRITSRWKPRAAG